MTIVNGFQAKEERSGFIPLLEGGVFIQGKLSECSMRPNQKHVFDHFRDEPFMVVSQPPGSGKSTLIKFVHGHDLKNDPTRKLVIAVPMSVIAKTFRAVQLNFEDGSSLRWDVYNDLCVDAPRKVGELVRFLSFDQHLPDIASRVVLCTHATLAAAMPRVWDDFASVIKNTTFVIDEAHHVLSMDDSEEVINRLGQFCSRLIDANEPTTKLWLPTGTFFRGDRLSIIKSRLKMKPS
jgi:hypothetical protein